MCLLYSYICHISYICLILSAMNALDIQNKHHYYVSGQGFMQDKIIASYTCFGGYMDVNC